MRIDVVFLTLTVIVLNSCLSLAQTKINDSQIRLIEKNHQLCLDTGVNGLSCTIKYYYQINDLLNLAFENRMSTLNDQEKSKLNREQYLWLKSRNLKFKSIDTSNTMPGKDGDMIRLNEKADFLKKGALKIVSN